MPTFLERPVAMWAARSAPSRPGTASSVLAKRTDASRGHGDLVESHHRDVTERLGIEKNEAPRDLVGEIDVGIVEKATHDDPALLAVKDNTGVGLSRDHLELGAEPSRGGPGNEVPSVITRRRSGREEAIDIALGRRFELETVCGEPVQQSDGTEDLDPGVTDRGASGRVAPAWRRRRRSTCHLANAATILRSSGRSISATVRLLRRSRPTSCSSRGSRAPFATSMLRR